MATSNEKLAALHPQVTAELETMLLGQQQLGPLLRPALAFIRPQLDRKVDDWLAKPTDELDAVLGDLAAMLARLRSDDATPIDLTPAPLEPALEDSSTGG